jgi:hypothetical protein
MMPVQLFQQVLIGLLCIFVRNGLAGVANFDGHAALQDVVFEVVVHHVDTWRNVVESIMRPTLLAHHAFLNN